MSKVFQRVEAYLAELRSNGESLPLNQFGDVNFTLIAEKCGTRRQWFSENAHKKFGSDNETLSVIIDRLRGELGGRRSQRDEVAEKISKQRDDASKQVNELRKTLNLKLSELEGLRNEVDLLKAENKLLRAKLGEQDEIMEMVSDTGRSFHWNI